MRKFHYVDFAAHFQKGFRNHIAPVSDVPALVESFGRYGCYATYFFYSDEILTYLSTRVQDQKPTLSGYDGKVWAPYFPIDIDHPDFQSALEAARFFVRYFLEEWKVPAEGLQVYFSGSKGFHLMLDSRVFGKITPSKTLPLIFASLRRHLSLELSETLRPSVDLSIKDRVRLLRLPNTLHEKSGLHKVLIKRSELESLDETAIRGLAKALRTLDVTDETGLMSKAAISENQAASKFYGRIRRQVRHITRKPFEYHFRRPADVMQLDYPCLGLKKIWETHVEPGFRNNAAIRLASELRLLGLTEGETLERLCEWNDRNNIYLPFEEIQNVARSAFQHPFPYRYSCRDEILRHFCPLGSYAECQAYVARQTKQA